MLRAISILALTLIPTAAAANGLPLFDAFKKFCFETASQPQKANAAVKMAGGTLHSPAVASPSEAPNAPFPLTLWTWNVTVEGDQFLVSTGTGYPASKFPNKEHSNFDNCTITGFVADDASVKALQSWLKIAPDRLDADKATPDFGMAFYSWAGDIQPNRLGDASDHSKLHDWSLVLMRTRQGASLQFTHVIGADSRK